MSPYQPQSPDTDPEVERLQFEILGGMTPEEKCARVAELIATTRRLAELGIRKRHPEASDREVFLRLVSTWLDRESMIQAYGFDPDPNRS